MEQYFPKRPVKSFLDLEVYQTALATAVFITRYIIERPSPDIAISSEKMSLKDTKNKKHNRDEEEKRDQLSISDNVGSGTAKSLIFHNMLPCALGLPHLIAEAHSYRFGNQPECLQLLEKAMLHCNKMVVYLEETRDIIETSVEWEKFDETIKKYQYLRRKLLNLQRSWKKYMQPGN